MTARHVYILACRHLAGHSRVHFFTLNSCRFSKASARRVVNTSRILEQCDSPRLLLAVLSGIQTSSPLSECCSLTSSLSYSRLDFSERNAIIYLAIVYDCHVISVPVFALR